MNRNPSNSHLRWTVLACGWLAVVISPAVAAGADPVPDPLRAILMRAEKISGPALDDAKARGMNAIVLPLATPAVDPAESSRVTTARARQIREAGFRLYYWIEIGRCPELADAHPEWMASLQGHPEWRRLFKDPPVPGKAEVVKNYPWVPILYEESFAAHLARVKRLVSDLPVPEGLFLNDLQGGPSACGCGNTLCRWTADYGDILTATPLKPDAAVRFVEQVELLVPGAEIVPVWTTECEEADCDQEGHCAGVGCFEGICWKAYTSQLMPVAERCRRMGALLLYKALERDLSRYGPPGGWIPVALDTFRTMPPQRKGQPIPANRLIAVLQGWDVRESEVDAQQQLALQAGAAGFVLSTFKIDQSWEPRIHKVIDRK